MIHSFRSTYQRRSRGSYQRCYVRKGILRNFAKFKGKHLFQGLFLKKLAGVRAASLLQKRLWRRCLPENFTKFLRTPFHKKHLWWLLLMFYTKRCLQNTSGQPLLVLFRVSPCLNIIKMLGCGTHKEIFKKAYEMNN